MRNESFARPQDTVMVAPMPMQTSSDILEARDLCVQYPGFVALDGVSHAFAPSRWTHILGANGAGKSTLLKAIGDLIRPDRGDVFLGDVPLGALSARERARRIAYVPQRLESLPPLTVAGFVAHGTFAWDEPAPQAAQRAQDALEELGIASFAPRLLPELSGGELQLCVLASAIAQDARIILLDEPTSALDIRHAEMLCTALRNMTKRGVTVVSSTHALPLAARYADESILLHDGRCLWQGAGFPPPAALADAFGMPAAYFETSYPLATMQEGPIPMNGEEFCAREPKDHECACEPFSDTRHADMRTDTARPPLRRPRVLTGALIAFFLALLLAGPWVGATWAQEDGVFWMLRVPRVLWGAIAGSALAICGGVLQALFQNSLATPYTLGIASGASFGAMTAIQLGIAGVLGLSLCAAAGGMVTLAAVLFIATKSGLRQPMYCLLAGVAASMFCAAAGLVVQAFASPLTAQQMMRWQLGGLEIAGYSSFASVPVIAVAAAFLFAQARPLEILSVDADLAASRGVRVERTRALALAAAGIATALIVSVCGPIGFVGLIVPNAVRRFTGANLRRLLPLSAIAGASFLMLADTVARVLERVAWIPAGVVTALAGTPIFLAILMRNGNK